MRTIIPSVARMMKIMEIIIGGERKELQRRPAEIVAAVSVEGIEHAKDQPDYESAYVHGTNQRGQLDARKGGDGLGDEELERMEMEASKGDSVRVLMMDLMEGIEKGLMKGVVSTEEEKVLSQHHQEELQ